MLSIHKSINGYLLVAPLMVGALLSGAVYLTDSSTLPVTAFQGALLFTFLLFLLQKVVEGSFEVEVYGLETYYLLFLGIIFFSTIYTPDREEALFFSFRFMVLLFMTYVIYNVVRSERDLKVISYIAVIAAVGVASQNLIQIYFNPEIAAYNYAGQGTGRLMRTTGENTDPNIFAINFTFPALFLLALFNSEKKVVKRLILFGLFMILIGSVLLTYSRSSWVSLGLGGLVIILISRKYRIVGYLAVIFLVAFSVSGTVQQLTFSFLERLLDIFAGSSDDSSKYRIVLAETAVQIIMDSYLLGIGFQGFSSVFKEYHPPQTTAGIFEPHNQYYAVFAELGLIGIIVFMLILYRIAYTAFENLKLSQEENFMRRLSLALFGSIISYYMFYNFLGGMLYDSILFIVIGLVFATHKVQMKAKTPVPY